MRGAPPSLWVLSHVWLFAISWTVAYQVPLSMGLSQQERWSRLSFPPKGYSQPRNWTHISCGSCIGKQILYYWTNWEAHIPGVLEANEESLDHHLVPWKTRSSDFALTSLAAAFRSHLLKLPPPMPSSRGPSQPRDQTCYSMSPALAGGLFTTNATRSSYGNCVLFDATEGEVYCPGQKAILFALFHANHS